MIGKRLSVRLNVPFADADHAIEEAAGMTVAEIFAKYGEAEFRRLERSVIARLLHDKRYIERFERISKGNNWDN